MALARWLRLAARAKALDGSGLRPADRRVDLPRRAERAAVLPADLLQEQHVSDGWQLPGTWESPALTAARHAHRAVLTAAIRHGKEAVPIAYLLISPRPGADQLLFASTDPEVAEARGVPVGRLGLLFLLELALTVTGAAQVVGTPLVLSLAITPAAAAQRLSASPLVVTALSVVFAVVAADGGLPASEPSTSRRASSSPVSASPSTSPPAWPVPCRGTAASDAVKPARSSLPSGHMRLRTRVGGRQHRLRDAPGRRSHRLQPPAGPRARPGQGGPVGPVAAARSERRPACSSLRAGHCADHGRRSAVRCAPCPLRWLPSRSWLPTASWCQPTCCGGGPSSR